MSQPVGSKFSGEPVLITGGAGGMGEAMARRLAMSGARIAVVDLKPDAAADAVSRMTNDGLDVIGVAADTTDEEAMSAAVAETVRSFGSLYGLITAAGIRQTAAGFTELDLTMWRTI